MTVLIDSVNAYRRFDSRGNPTIEAVVTAGEFTGRALVPSGASTGEHEALELRDNEEDYGGKDVEKAINSVDEIEKLLINKDPLNQQEIDKAMIELDGTQNKQKLGANDILAVSLAVARLGAQISNVPLFLHIAQTFEFEKPSTLPMPLFNVLNGGAHANWEGSDFQEFMIVPVGASSFEEAMRTGTEVYHSLAKVLEEKGFATQVGDEGGFVPRLKQNSQAIDVILEAIEKANYKVKSDIVLALDPAVSELYDSKTNTYTLKTENQTLQTHELISLWKEWVYKYPIFSLEDGLDEDDWQGWSQLTYELGESIQIVGDDFLVTNKDRVARAIKEKSANSLLVKVNQIGTLTETIEAIDLCHKNGWKTIISHRSGETEDPFISDLSVAVGASQIKAGAPARSDRVVKYNRLLDIEQIDLPDLNIKPLFSKINF